MELQVTEEIFAHFDGDDIGPGLEILLLDGLLDEASEYSRKVAQGMQELSRRVTTVPGVRIIVFGGDDLVVAWPREEIQLLLIRELQQNFACHTSRTISVGIGHTSKSAIENLHRAKLLGRNRIVSTIEGLE
jgi:hypothetical protein